MVRSASFNPEFYKCVYQHDDVCVGVKREKVLVSRNLFLYGFR